MIFRVWIEPPALDELRAVPGNVRQQLRRELERLAKEPRPPASKKLEWPGADFEPRRLRVGNWRVVYAVNDGDRWVQVLAVRKRPPYDYGDLQKLFEMTE